MDRVGVEPTTAASTFYSSPSAIGGNIHNISLLIIEEADCSASAGLELKRC
ncbi:MAG TPA: hypothetical protein VKA40_03680 [Nitrososphaera sp.]|nr:hypothetical protein [Nitrososphaera sp.]